MIQPKTPGLPLPRFTHAVYYDPPSHDFLTWLVIATTALQQRGIPGPLHVRFAMIDGMLGRYDWSHYSLSSGQRYFCERSKEYSDTMITNVLRPAIQMIGAIEDPPYDLSGYDSSIESYAIRLNNLSGWVEYSYHISTLVDACRDDLTLQLPKFTPPQWAFDQAHNLLNAFDKPVITVTLRESNWQPERNTNTEAWMRFAYENRRTFAFVFIRDTAKAHDPLDAWVHQFDSRFISQATADIRTFSLASINAFVRCALYQSAFLNCFTCNGPQEWAHLTDAPYLIFKQIIPELPDWPGGNVEGWRNQAHLEVGQQFPWASKRQVMTWTDDTYENITEAFEAILPELQS